MSSSPIHKCLKILYTKAVDNFLLVVSMSLTIAAVVAMARSKPNDLTDGIQALDHSHHILLMIGLFLATAVTVYIMQRPRMVYLIDYHYTTAPIHQLMVSRQKPLYRQTISWYRCMPTPLMCRYKWRRYNLYRLTYLYRLIIGRHWEFLATDHWTPLGVFRGQWFDEIVYMD